ncbi:Beta-ketoacyl-acyl-carrier-protein synthase III [Ruminiclostridium papyrosolvens DSM 2782]|uniref:Beta-ketoacyl-acyl-carrier-protein synthase III n=1 Tax=Ruminiclostridium papyrosolvens DSM 2782 TaxID=588581 RepID=F1TGW6_9FIRM|nr:ketoacyl-ACP synthase III [Ruminiclostridium papyrosolvens]EGD46447.1 Beta-ketoacyl-acyl-carrier-protein synthase III [Ruminiclostridium papyrosolvens DSM 2782]WES33939.1 ketoacyl-ACP synthase III [Ruminiclostridium papyrosolvens DSM 2782]
MFFNLKIMGVGTYHPKNEIDNKYFVEHFKKMNKDPRPLLKHLGRERRFKAKKFGNENSVTMAIEASKKAIADAKIDINDIDMIVFASDFPEYVSPSNALMISSKLNSRANIVFDMNSNCISMISALDIIDSYIKNKDINNVLLVSSCMITPCAREDDIVVYPSTADASAAVILQKITEKNRSGVIDSGFYTDCSYNWTIKNPACGFSRITDNSVDTRMKMMEWNQFDFSFLSDNWCKLIYNLLDKNSLTPEDVSLYLFSQFSKADIMATIEKLNVMEERIIYVGNKYGYTGPTSPILALNEAKKTNKIVEGSYAILCSVGSGYTMGALLYKF